jgi:hypothetical protein
MLLLAHAIRGRLLLLLLLNPAATIVWVFGRNVATAIVLGVAAPVANVRGAVSALLGASTT